MKKQKQKKFWAWTEKQKRRRLRGRCGKSWSSGPTKAFTQPYEDSFRAHNKKSLARLMKMRLHLCILIDTLQAGIGGKKQKTTKRLCQITKI